MGLPAVGPLIAAIETEPRVGPVTLGELRELAQAPPIAGKDDDRMHQIVTKASLNLPGVVIENMRYYGKW